jgi:hypothetical protein
LIEVEMSAEEMPQGDVGEQIMARSLSIQAKEFQPTSTPVPPAVSKTLVLFLIYLRQVESKMIDKKRL